MAVCLWRPQFGDSILSVFVTQFWTLVQWRGSYLQGYPLILCQTLPVLLYFPLVVYPYSSRNLGNGSS